jgi:hypothetical protein
MKAVGGNIVLTPGEAQPYKVVLEYHPFATTEHPVATVREGEALIRRALPKPKRHRGDIPTFLSSARLCRSTACPPPKMLGCFRASAVEVIVENQVQSESRIRVKSSRS